MNRLLALRVCLSLLGLGLSATVPAQPISFTSVPPGYAAGSIALPRGFQGGIGVDPTNDNILYASVGNFADNNIVRIDLSAQTATVVATGPFGSVAGIAPLSANRIVIVDSHGATGSGLSTDTLLLATDGNTNGNFNDPGEIVELIPPILESGFFGFTGSQARMAPAGNPSGIPSGSLVAQTADGSGGSEILVVANPLTAPAYRPAGAAYFSGFDYNGGFDFDSAGRIFMGALTGSFTGEITALVNTDNDEDIDPGESHVLLAGENGMSDLAIDRENDVFFTGFDATFTAVVRSFRAPANALSGTVAPFNFASTDASFLGGMLLNSRTKSFQPGGGPNGAVMVIGGFASSNLLTLTPSGPTRAHGWEAYE